MNGPDAPRLRDWIELTKARILGFALLAAVVAMAFAHAQAGTALEPLRVAVLIVGLALTAAGAAALNQVIEAPIDALMERTRRRPIPAGRLSRDAALAFALLAGAGGVAWLTWLVNPLTGGLALTMLAVYDFVYTPLKRVTPLNTVIGAFPGAMPVLIGWAAAGHGLSQVAGILFAILFLWQFPHFMAIAWIHRDDYRRAGLKMVSVADERFTGRQALQYALALVPVSLLPSFAGAAGRLYFFGALALSLIFLAFALRFCLGGSTPRARWLLRVSIAYLPLLFALLAVDSAGAAIG
ncbi:MAG TPA: heme o synthase [Planctomycetota bacterium]